MSELEVQNTILLLEKQASPFTIYSKHEFDLERNQKVNVFKTLLAEEMAKAITNGFKQAVWLN